MCLCCLAVDSILNPHFLASQRVSFSPPIFLSSSSSITHIGSLHAQDKHSPLPDNRIRIPLAPRTSCSVVTVVSCRLSVLASVHVSNGLDLGPPPAWPRAECWHSVVPRCAAPPPSLHKPYPPPWQSPTLATWPRAMALDASGSFFSGKCHPGKAAAPPFHIHIVHTSTLCYFGSNRRLRLFSHFPIQIPY